MKKTLNKKSARRKRKVMSPEERLRKKEQRDQMKEIRDIMFRIGFTRLSGIDGKEFVYDGRTSELDDIFICENVILLTEYTIGDPHILKKKIIYDKINSDIHAFSENDIRMYKDQNRREEIVIDENGNFVGDNKRTNVTPAYVEILNKCNIIGIIDGQHRTFAYHEGNDVYEESIKRLRKIQNLLVTGIIFPKTESKENRLKFEAGLFLEINSNQKKVGQLIQQEIQMQIKPFSNIAVSKRILNMLNEHGALANMIELYTYEKGKIKTASVVSFGLKPLIKFDLDKNDSFYSIWNHENKKELLEANCQNYALLDEYIKFCVKEINEVMSAFKSCLKSYEWKPYCAKASSGVLTVTFINGVLNLIRLLIENNQLNGIDSYRDKLKSIDGFNIKQYKSSQYRRMGEDIYNKYFTTK